MILHFLHILRNRQIHRPKQPVLPCILTGAEVLHFLKIYSYYSIINRGNQLLFATFLSQIANSFVCTKSTMFPEGFLVISDNLIFSDGFHPGNLHFSAGFFPNPAVAYQRQTYRSCAICCTIGPSGGPLYPLRLQPSAAAPAFCNLPGGFFHHFRHKTQKERGKAASPAYQR